MHFVSVRDIPVFAELPIAEGDFMVGANGLEQGSQVFRPRGVWGALELDDVAVAVGVQMWRHSEAICDFPKGLIELLEDGEVPELNQRVRGKANGIEVVVVQLHVIDAVPFLSVVVAALVSVVFDGGIESKVCFVAHGPEVFLHG